jgi:phosphoribosylformylglycinamidine synthase
MVKKNHHHFSNLIKKTSETNPNEIVSAYKDNVAFIKGPIVEQFAPKRADIPEYYTKQKTLSR